MAKSKQKISLQSLGAYREPVLFLGGGFVAGLVIFLLWLAALPSVDKAQLHADVSADATHKPVAGEQGVLNGITGGAESAPDSFAITQADGAQPSPAPDDVPVGFDADAAARGDIADANPSTAVSDEQAIANGLLDAPSPVQPGPEPEMQTWYVEVVRGPGVSEIIAVNAESADNALSIIRDYRGNPRILRGPSTSALH